MEALVVVLDITWLMLSEYGAHWSTCLLHSLSSACRLHGRFWGVGTRREQVDWNLPGNSYCKCCLHWHWMEVHSRIRCYSSGIWVKYGVTDKPCIFKFCLQRKKADLERDDDFTWKCVLSLSHNSDFMRQHERTAKHQRQKLQFFFCHSHEFAIDCVNKP